jgi:hypothetical protein
VPCRPVNRRGCRPESLPSFRQYPSLIARMEQACEGTSIVFLQNREARFGDVRILGTCLWTAMGSNQPQNGDRGRDWWRAVTDYRSVGRDDGQCVRPEEIIGYHREAVAWLEERLAVPFAGATVVVTHHAPSYLHPCQAPKSSARGCVRNASRVSRRTGRSLGARACSRFF